MATRVLIADSDLKTRDSLSRNLACWGYEIVVAETGDEAWSILQLQDAPKIVLLDARVAGVPCFDLCRRVRALRGDHSFVLVFTNDEGSEEAKVTHLDALEAGADGAIAKPLNLRELRMRLAAGLRGRRLAVSDAPLPAPSQHASRPSSMSPRDPSDRELMGRIVARKYQVERLIGKGGMGTVWQGTHLTLGIPVAIKFIKAEHTRHPLARARFELEARTAARLQTKYAVRILDYGVTEDGLPYIVMEYLEGPSLLQRVQRSGPLSFSETVNLITQTAHALEQLHASGTIHRDVKPDNILLVADPDASVTKRAYIAKIIDFGVAKVVARSSTDAGPQTISTQHGIVIGTPNFMPPEQLRGEDDATVRGDIWALAACAFTAMTGRAPFEGGTIREVVRKVCQDPLPIPSQLDASVPPEFDAWFARACSRDPELRFQSARELARALGEAHLDHADASLELTPSLKSFVALPSVSIAPRERGASMRPTTRPGRQCLFELDAPTLAFG